MENTLEVAAGNTLLEVKDVKVHFPVRGGLLGRANAYVKAVDGVNLSVKQGETVGLVGESGCGKSTTGRAILQLIKPTSGSVRFKDKELTRLDARKICQARADMQMIFRDPFGSLDLRFSVGVLLESPGRLLRAGASSGEQRGRTSSRLFLPRMTYDKGDPFSHTCHQF